MNLFLLDPNPFESVKHYNNNHVVKMTSEYSQLLSTALFQFTNTQLGWKPTHTNHPSNIWVRESICNFQYTTLLLEAIIIEHHLRWPDNKHKFEKSKLLLQTCKNFINFPTNLRKGLTPIRLATNQHILDAGFSGFKAYQAYYAIYKRSFGQQSKPYQWSHRGQPIWHIQSNLDLFPIVFDDFSGQIFDSNNFLPTEQAQIDMSNLIWSQINSGMFDHLALLKS